MNLPIHRNTNSSHHKNWFKLFQPFIISTFWLLLFVAPIFFGPSGTEVNWDHVLRVWLMLVPYLILYLINRFLLVPFLFMKGKKLGFFLGSLSFLLLIGLGTNRFFDPMQNAAPAQQSNEGHMPDHFNDARPLPPHLMPNGERPNNAPRTNQPTPPPPMHLPPYLSFFIIGILIIGFDTGLKLSVIWVQSEQNRVKAEKENMESQLAMLRNQVSPHFFMNTLNNIHALIEYDTESAKDCVIRLSKLMRHLLYDAENDVIPLRKELDFVRQYVELMKIRFSQSVVITFEVPHQIPDKNIPPLLFTSFIENAFKHGISYQEESYVHILFSSSGDQLLFSIENSNFSTPDKSNASGIGVTNAKQRLNLLYGDRATLNIEETKKIYQVKLNIPL